MENSLECFPSLPFRHPVLTTERDQGDEQAVCFAIRTKHDGDAMPPPSVPDEPAFQRWTEPHPGHGFGDDASISLRRRFAAAKSPPVTSMM